MAPFSWLSNTLSVFRNKEERSSFSTAVDEVLSFVVAASKASKASTRVSKSKSSKRPLNEYFKLMLDAKKKGLDSFKYKGSVYKGRKHETLGMVYKKA